MSVMENDDGKLEIVSLTKVGWNPAAELETPAAEDRNYTPPILDLGPGLGPGGPQ